MFVTHQIFFSVQSNYLFQTLTSVPNVLKSMFKAWLSQDIRSWNAIEILTIRLRIYSLDELAERAVPMISCSRYLFIGHQILIICIFYVNVFGFEISLQSDNSFLVHFFFVFFLFCFFIIIIFSFCGKMYGTEYHI